MICTRFSLPIVSLALCKFIFSSLYCSIIQVHIIRCYFKSNNLVWGTLQVYTPIAFGLSKEINVRCNSEHQAHIYFKQESRRLANISCTVNYIILQRTSMFINTKTSLTLHLPFTKLFPEKGAIEVVLNRKGRLDILKSETMLLFYSLKIAWYSFLIWFCLLTTMYNFSGCRNGNLRIVEKYMT